MRLMQATLCNYYCYCVFYNMFKNNKLRIVPWLFLNGKDYIYEGQIIKSGELGLNRSLARGAKLLLNFDPGYYVVVYRDIDGLLDIGSTASMAALDF